MLLFVFISLTAMPRGLGDEGFMIQLRGGNRSRELTGRWNWEIAIAAGVVPRDRIAR